MAPVVPDAGPVWNNLAANLTVASPHGSWFLVACAIGTVLLVGCQTLLASLLRSGNLLRVDSAVTSS